MKILSIEGENGLNLYPNETGGGVVISMEEMRDKFLKAKKLHEKQLEWCFVNDVYGIGEITTDKFLKKFRNADKIFSATVEKIAEVLGIIESRARNIRKKLDEHPKE